MNHSKRLCAFSMVLVSAVLFGGCLLDSSKPSDPPNLGGTSNGNFYIQSPFASQILKMDSTATIRWTAIGVNSDQYIEISLYREDAKVATITTGRYATGTYSWSVGRYGAGTSYRIKIADYNDSARYDMSNYFTIRSNYSGTISVTAPESGDVAHIYDTLGIRWSTTGSIGSYVGIQLWSDTAMAYAIVTNTSASSGYYRWSSINTNKGSGDRYRVRIHSYYDSSIVSFSPYFTLTSQYDGTISVTEPSAGHSCMINDTLGIRWSTTGSIGAYVGLQLYNDTALAATITSSTSTSNGYYRWSSISTNKGSGDKYRVKVYSYYDPAIYEYSPYFTVNTQYNGSYDITAPDTTTTWAAGNTYSITWSSTGTPGSYVKIDLYQGPALQSTLSSSATNNGSYSWSVPNYTTTGKYRIKLSSYYDSGISAYSDTFTINGLTADSYEPDNVRDQASNYTPDGAVQQRSLTYGDTDWVAIPMEKGKTYSFRNNSSIRVYAYLFRGTASSQSTNFYLGGSSSYYIQTYVCDSTMTYNVRITPYSSSYYGSYFFSVKEIDPAKVFSISAPDSGTPWSAGSSYSIQWTRDSSVGISSVNIYLCSDTTKLTSIYSYYSSSSYSGQYSWSIPSGMATGNNYRIRIEDNGSTGYHGYSRPFAISGVASDAYEWDNQKTGARGIETSGTAQAHTITYADTDWISFTAKKDSLYLIQATGTTYLYLYLYSSQSSSQIAYASYSSRKIFWACTTAGTYYVQMTPYSTYTGAYDLKVRSYSQLELASFTEPSDATTWAAGTNHDIVWTPDTSLFGTYVRLSLYRGPVLIQSITSSTANDGSHPWTPPAGLATGNSYRLYMQNSSTTQIAGYSDTFAIVGLAPDAYEPDDSLSLARNVEPDSAAQNRTLTYADRDWCQFRAEQNTLYRIRAKGIVGLTDTLFAPGGATPLATGTFTSADSTSVLTWFCSTTGNYPFKIGSSSGATGSYSLALTSYAAADYRFSITVPDTNQVCTKGASVTISWNDPVGVGGWVDIFLYDSGLPVSPAIVAGTPNNGSHPWTIPSALVAGSNYTIQVISTINSHISGTSGAFTIQ